MAAAVGGISVTFRYIQSVIIPAFNRQTRLCFAAAALVLTASFNPPRPNVLKKGIKLMEKEAVLIPAGGQVDYPFFASPWVTNREYKLYLSWMDKVLGADYPNTVTLAFPNPKVPDSCPLPADYFSRFWMHPTFDDLPVLGLSWQQAMAYAHWRSDIYNEWLYIKAGVLQPYPDQIGEDRFNLEAFLYGQYESGTRVEGFTNPKIADPSWHPPKGSYFPGFRLPTALELAKIKALGPAAMADLKPPLLAEPKHFLSHNGESRYKAQVPVIDFVAQDTALQKRSLGASIVDYELSYGTNYGRRFPSLFAHYHEFGVDLIIDTHDSYRRLEKGLWRKEIYAYLREVDAFAARPDALQLVQSFINQQGSAFVLEPQGTPKDAKLGTRIKIFPDDPPFNGIRDQENVLVEKFQEGTLLFQLVGMDQKGVPLIMQSQFYWAWADDAPLYLLTEKQWERVRAKAPPRNLIHPGDSVSHPQWFEGVHTSMVPLVSTPFPIGDQHW